MIRPNNPEIDAVALSERLAADAERLREMPAANTRRPETSDESLRDANARASFIAELIDAATSRAHRAVERNVPRTDVPRALRALGKPGSLLVRAYNAAFNRQREIAGEQNDALLAIVHALEEIAAAQCALADAIGAGIEEREHHGRE